MVERTCRCRRSSRTSSWGSDHPSLSACCWAASAALSVLACSCRRRVSHLLTNLYLVFKRKSMNYLKADMDTHPCINSLQIATLCPCWLQLLVVELIVVELACGETLLPTVMWLCSELLLLLWFPTPAIPLTAPTADSSSRDVWKQTQLIKQQSTGQRESPRVSAVEFVWYLT